MKYEVICYLFYYFLFQKYGGECSRESQLEKIDDTDEEAQTRKRIKM
jgi:hypothetical protein